MIYFQLISFAAKPSAVEHFNKASVQYMSGNFTDALKQLEASLKLDPKYEPALELKRIVLKERETLQLMLKQKLSAGKNLYYHGDYAQAFNYFNEVLMISPDNLEAASYLKRIEEKVREENRAAERRFWMFFGSLAIGLVSLAFLLRLIFKPIIEAVRKRIFYSQNIGHCFNCRTKISPNTDLCPNCGAWIGSKLRGEISKEQKIWYQKTGWRKNPFTLDIHPELFTGYRDEVKQILEKVAAKSGHILITGPLGVGKTTLLRWLSNYLRLEAYPIYIPRPPQSIVQIIKAIYYKLGVNSTDYDIYNLDALRKKLGKSLILLLDEAHEFSVEFERPLRTLGDLDEVKLVMAGLPETTEKFKNEIKPLYERIVLNIGLERLNFEDLKALIIIRIENAGGKGIHPFTVSALEKIHELSQGIPRSAIKFCDAAVTRAIEVGEDKITPEIVEATKR
jgi:type II secretory pathway predicted ATPase ExeA